MKKKRESAKATKPSCGRSAKSKDRYAEKYIRTLECALKLARKDIAFYRGKSERLELAVMNQATPAAKEYVERSTPRKPAVSSARIKPSERLPFSAVREQWNRLTLEQQDKAVQEGSLVIKESEAV